MSKSRIGIVDYGSANIGSVRQQLGQLGYACPVIHSPQDLENVSLLVLPGVGAFPSAMLALLNRNLVVSIQSWAKQGKPLLGICLGMQLLAESSYEQGVTKGLGILPGVIKPLANSSWHIGWNQLDATKYTPKFLHEALTLDYYFNHSYEFNIADKYVLATSDLQTPIVSMVGHENVVGIQPHPEKSQSAGRLMLQVLLKEMLHA